MTRLIAAAQVLAMCSSAWAASLDIAPGGYGLSIGNSKRINGLRLNARDAGVERVTGINVTLWKAGANPDAVHNGITAGIVGPEASDINGVAFGLLGAGAKRNVRGIAIGGLGAGAGESLTGAVIGGLGAGAGGSVTGLVIGGLGAGAGDDLTGLVLAFVGAGAGSDVRGVVIGGIGAGAGERMTGIILGGLGAGAGDEFTGIGFGLAGVGAGGNARGLLVGGLGAGAGGQLTGVALSVGRVSAGERITGAVVAGLGVTAKEIRGVAFGGVNGISYGDGNFETGNQRFTGLSVGIVNVTRELHGLQLGILNYAGNNPRWARWLPLLNLHL